MKNKSLIISLLIFFIIGLLIYFVFFFANNNNTKTEDYSTTRTEANINTTPDNQNSLQEDMSNEDKSNENTSNENSDEPQNSEPKQEEQNSEPKPEKTETETEISSFSTKIHTKDSNRQNNVKITCSSLNDTLVENGATFSLCNTVGQATTSKGYKKAEIFDANRK